MNKYFSLRMAKENLQRNTALYGPFLLTSISSVMMCYVFSSLLLNPDFDSLYGGGVTKLTLGFGRIVILVTAAMILLYANSFVMKNRSREIGLYEILGLERRHVQRILAIEMLIITAISLAGGLLLGIAIDQLAYGLLLRLMQLPISLKAHLFPRAFAETAVAFVGIFTLLFLVNGVRVRRIRALHLLKEQNQGEKLPRHAWVGFLAGSALLGSAYYLSQKIESPVVALTTFFVAVLLVIAGTYLLFTSGSIWILQRLKKQPRFYYKPDNFIAVSNLLFRMRKNAAGLASICILSTMVIITLITSFALYSGTKNTILALYPHTYAVSADQHTGKEKSTKDLRKALAKMQSARQEAVQKLGLTETGHADLIFLTSLGERQGEVFRSGAQNFQELVKQDKISLLIAIELSAYNQLENQNLRLAPGEIAADLPADFSASHFQIQNHSYPIRHTFSSGDLLRKLPIGQVGMMTNEQYVVVVPDIEVFAQESGLDVLKETDRTAYSGFNVEVPKDRQIALLADLQPYYGKPVGQDFKVQGQANAEAEYFTLNGSVFFLGTFLGLMFLAGTILIIYYKQISEGYQDKEQFILLQKVGLDHKAVKKTIHRQVMIFFFLPLAAAVIHTLFAFKMYAKILQLLGTSDTHLVVLVSCLVIGAFGLAYFLVYRLTSQAYLKLITRPTVQ